MERGPSGEDPDDRILLWSPTLEDAGCCAELARCLSRAFSTGLWRSSPMPVGRDDDPCSALGVIAGLGERPVLLAASRGQQGGLGQDVAIIGCVLGAILDRRMIEAYRLGPFGACAGDGLLAFIGIVPESQGSRARPSDATSLEIVRGPSSSGAPSLARILFERWIAAPTIRRCPRVFVRTRRRIGPILHLSRSYGFEYCGAFELDFRGERQDRLVYRRTNGEDPPSAC